MLTDLSQRNPNPFLPMLPISVNAFDLHPVLFESRCSLESVLFFIAQESKSHSVDVVRNMAQEKSKA